MEAYESALRGREILLGKNRTRATFEQVEAFFLKAIELDPNYAQAYAGLGFAYMFDYQNRWSDDPDGSLGKAKRYAELAIEKDPKRALAHAIAAVVAGFSRDLEKAKAEIDIALSLNPNLALANNVFGTMRIYSGQPLEAIPAIERAMRLDPAGNGQFLHFLGLANLLAGKYETAVALFKQRVLLVPGDGFFPRHARVRSRPSRRGRGGAPRLGRARTDQSQILVPRSLQPATLQEPGRRRAHRRGSHQGRIAGLSGPIRQNRSVVAETGDT